MKIRSMWVFIPVLRRPASVYEWIFIKTLGLIRVPDAISIPEGLPDRYRTTGTFDDPAQ